MTSAKVREASRTVSHCGHSHTESTGACPVDESRWRLVAPGRSMGKLVQQLRQHLDVEYQLPHRFVEYDEVGSTESSDGPIARGQDVTGVPRLETSQDGGLAAASRSRRTASPTPCRS
ncbi:hypothetical protein [Streptomyces sp. NPDC058677]|uniref:hypothetical protein n=1 Tax=Streptomyces sp. NPDC058677 TaxID=3346594 RepID=UPI003651D5C2